MSRKSRSASNKHRQQISRGNILRSLIGRPRAVQSQGLVPKRLAGRCNMESSLQLLVKTEASILCTYYTTIVTIQQVSCSLYGYYGSIKHAITYNTVQMDHSIYRVVLSSQHLVFRGFETVTSSLQPPGTHTAITAISTLQWFFAPRGNWPSLPRGLPGPFRA